MSPTRTAGAELTSTSTVAGTPKASLSRASVLRFGFDRPCSSATSTPLLTPERAASWSSDQPCSARSVFTVRATALDKEFSDTFISFPSHRCGR
jgi:hypothetical protein